MLAGIFGAHRIYMNETSRAAVPLALVVSGATALGIWIGVFHCTIAVDIGGIFGAFSLVALILALVVWIVDGFVLLLIDVTEYNVMNRDVDDDAQLHQSLVFAGRVPVDYYADGDGYGKA